MTISEWRREWVSAVLFGALFLTGSVARAQQQPQTNQPAAAPQENPPALTVPVDPPAAGEAAPATPAAGTPAAPAAPPTVTTAPVEGGTEGSTEATTAAAEGKEIAEVRVVGNRVVPGETILIQSSSRRGGAFSVRQLSLDLQKIDALGFFASVKHQVTPNLEDAQKVDVTFIVVENRVIKDFVFTGGTVVPEAELLKVLESKKGSVLNRNTVNNDVQKIGELYEARGFSVVTEDVQQGEDGTVTYVLKEARVTSVQILGARRTQESLLRTRIRVQPGSLFNRTAIHSDVNRLYDLNFFERVDPKAEADPQNPGGVIVTYTVKEKRTGSLSVGVGFDNRSKVTGFLSLSQNNFRGRGQRVSASAEIGGERTFDLGFSNPYIGQRNAGYDLAVYSRRIYREPRSVRLFAPGAPITFYYEEQRTGFRGNYVFPLDANQQRSLLFGYRNERARLFQTTGTGFVPVALPLASAGRTSAPSFGFLRDRRDLRIDPSTGGREQLIVEQALKLLGGSSNFTKLDLDLRRYLPLIKAPSMGELPKLVLAGRLVYGRAFGQLPAFEQYFIGGPDTVRGYDVDEQFGDNQFYSNLELRYRLQRKIQVVGFLDAGSSYGGNFASQRGIDWLWAFGAGVRLQTPIGPIRLDVGRGDRGVRTHFAIGSTF